MCSTHLTSALMDSAVAWGRQTKYPAHCDHGASEEDRSTTRRPERGTFLRAETRDRSIFSTVLSHLLCLLSQKTDDHFCMVKVLLLPPSWSCHYICYIVIVSFRLCFPITHSPRKQYSTFRCHILREKPLNKHLLIKKVNEEDIKADVFTFAFGFILE